MNDEHAHHAHGHLHHLIGVRVVHERAGFHQVELVDIGLAGRDRLVGQAAHPVHARGQDHAVPMDRGVLGQLVGHEYAHPVALDRLDRRTGGLTVISP